jgi:type II secretory pathway component PulK
MRDGTAVVIALLAVLLIGCIVVGAITDIGEAHRTAQHERMR